MPKADILVVQTLASRFQGLLPADRVKTVLLLALLFLHAVFSVFFVAPGHYSIDEVIYHMMARDMATSGSLSVWNGFEEFPSPELVLRFLLVQEDGSLAPQYPGLYAFLAAPFYWAMGFRGLFLINALAFAGAVGLCFLIARRLFDDIALALNACLVLVLATFAWQFSQAAWPHAQTMFVATLAVYCAVAALQTAQRRSALILAFLAGLAVGFGVGLRLDTIFAFPAVLLPFLFVVPYRPREALAACLGLVPGLLILAAINQAKFGIFSPFTYGQPEAGSTGGILRYLPLAAAGLIGAAGAWIATRPLGRAVLSRFRWPVIIGIGGLAIVVLATPQVWAKAAGFAKGAYQLLVDFRIRDLNIREGGLLRSPDGAMIYLGVLKKTLLQSAPYLTALVLPLVSFVRGRDVRALGVLFLAPAAYITVYSYFAWHGGQAFNLRYFVPIWPFLAILTAYAWRMVASDSERFWMGLAAAGGAATIAFHLATLFPEPPPLAEQEPIYLTAPLIVASVIGILLLATLAVPRDRARHLRGVACTAFVIGLAWGAAVNFAYDFRQAYAVRRERASLSADFRPFVQPDSLIFLPPIESAFGLIDTPRVRFAFPVMDNFASFRRLVQFHLRAGREVYIWLDPVGVKILRSYGLHKGLRYENILTLSNSTLTRITEGPTGNRSE